MTRTFRPRPTRTFRLVAVLAALAALGSVTACSTGGADSASPSSAAEAPALADQGDQAALAELGSELDSDGSVQGRDAADVQASVADDVGSTGAAYSAEDPTTDLSAPAVISTGWVSLESDDVAATRFDIRKVVDAQHGTITEQETTTGNGGDIATARLVVRVPAARFADAFAAFEELADLSDSSSTGQDVSAEVVDVDARVRAQRKSVARIEALLARAETIEQVVSVETQLASRQADLDALLSRQQWLADQTSQSTITVYVEQPAAAEPDTDDADGFLGGLRDGWDAFVDALVAGGAVLGFAVPWLIALAVVGVPLLHLLRRRGRSTPAPSA